MSASALDRTSLRVEREGGGPGAAATPLVLLHGWGMNLRVWDGVRPALAVDREVIAIDLPGHGGSGFDAAASTLEDQVELLQQDLPPRCSLLGWSLGGQFALRLAARWPAQVERLVLVATTPCFASREDWPCGMASTTLAGFARRLEQDYRGTVTEFLELQVRGSRNARQVLLALRAALLGHGEAQPRALRAGLEILRTADARALLPGIAQPSLVVGGEYDRVTPPAAARALAAALPRAELLELRRAAHAPFLSHPEEFLSRARSFLGHAS